MKNNSFSNCLCKTILIYYLSFIVLTFLLLILNYFEVIGYEYLRFSEINSNLFLFFKRLLFAIFLPTVSI